MSELERMGITAETSSSDNPAVDVDPESRILVLTSGEEVPITEWEELRPGLFAYMAGPTGEGSWLVGQVEYIDDTGIN